GRCNTCLMLYPVGNLAGKYRQEPEMHARGSAQFTAPWSWAGIAAWAYNFNQYCRKYGSNHDRMAPFEPYFRQYWLKYGSNHDRMAPFVVNLHRNGLMVDWGYYTVHHPTPFMVEDYLNARWICKPMSLLDADMPVQAASAYV